MLRGAGQVGAPNSRGLLNESWNPSLGVLASLLMGGIIREDVPGDMLALEDGAGAQALPSLRPA